MPVEVGVEAMDKVIPLQAERLHRQMHLVRTAPEQVAVAEQVEPEL